MSDLAVGIDVGGTKALALLVAGDGRVVHEVIAPTPHDEGFGAGALTTKVLAALVEELCDAHGVAVRSVPVGLGLPGMMGRDGRLAYAPNLPTASGADLGAQLRARLGHDAVVSENDANCAALAEQAWGAGVGVADFVMVTLGTGIGGGIVSNGALVRGRSGFAGEIGHMVVVANGVPCPCGSKGCWERYASGGGLQRMTREAARDGHLEALVEARHGDPERVCAEDVTAAAAEGDAGARALLERVGWWLALGLANLSAILDCGHFVIGGGLSSASSFVLPAARRHLAELVEGYDARPTITVVSSRFGARSGAMGAAAVARAAP